MTHQEAIAKLLSRVQEKGAGCWEWQGTKDDDGYGRVWLFDRTWRAHRASYHLFKGALSASSVVRHTCDNPACCNPNHLLLGTHADNVADRQARNRTARGERVGVKMHPERYVGALVGRAPKLYEYQGKGCTIKEIAAATGRSIGLLAQRLGKGWPVERAVAPPDLRFSRRRRAQ